MKEQGEPLTDSGQDRNRGGGRAKLAGALLVLGALPLVWWLGRGGDEAPVRVRTVEVPTPPPPVTVVDSLHRGQTLAEVLGAHGFDGVEIVHFVQAIAPYESPRRLRPGTSIRLIRRPTELPTRVSLALDADRTLHVFPDSSKTWRARLDSVPVTSDTIIVAGLVESNLFEAQLFGDVERLAPGESHELAFHISQIFQWQIDFWRDIRAGDAYRAAIAREVRPDGTVRSAQVLAAEFLNAGHRLSAIRFRASRDQPVEYYEEDGEALRSQFLFAPLDLARVTSGFSLRRFHPILKRYRRHLGIDYGAPAGTPVHATGDGMVTRAGRWGTYGRVVEIRHANNLRTRYAHLSSIAGGVRPGVRVHQGQVIGRVGASGLATASHLHYEFLRNGRQVNPARLNLPRAEPVPESLRPRFEIRRDAALALLNGTPLPGPMMVERSGTSSAGERTDD